MTSTTDSPEQPVYLRYLNAQRDHVLGILEGLSEEALHSSSLASGWTLLGMVQHLALDVERFWFRAVIAGEPEAIATLSNSAWTVAPDVTSADILATYRGEMARANVILSEVSFDAAPAWWPSDVFGDWRLGTVREIAMHVITEVASHAGHLDAARELIDGRAVVRDVVEIDKLECPPVHRCRITKHQ